MYLGLVMMAIGLVLLGTTLVKIWGTGAEEKVRTWYGIALVGAVVALSGLVLALRGMQQTGRQPEITGIPEKAPLSQIPEIPEQFKPKTTPKNTSAKEIHPEKNNENLPRKAREHREWMREQLQEDPDGKPYTEEDFQYIARQLEKIEKDFEQMKEETFYGRRPPEKADIPDRVLWNNFAFNMGVRLRNIRKRAAYKNGPGTAEIKKRVFAMVKFLSKIQRVYHTAIAENKPIDYQYISDLRSKVEMLAEEINELKMKQGIGTEEFKIKK